MRRLYVAALLAALASPTVSLAANGETRGSVAGAQVSENAETFGLLHPEMSRIDGRISRWSKNGPALDQSGYGFTYGGSWESSAPSNILHERKALYVHH
ncbi:hypothetical protein AWB65_06463 [Caballeronia humi]|uniref:Lipoprotein n=1 Tax=Caballeronia humi TaxID=326474 RepID=A0A158JEB4_9BURK|nr:hypothetical protein AWB65_06463 [Caballeronia humi]